MRFVKIGGNNMGSRFKNYGLWISIFALIALLPEAFGTYDIGFILPDNYEALVRIILAILVGAGIINNPETDNNGYGDDK
jgi:uncharacterized membrane protein